jgi:hypothetical protein
MSLNKFRGESMPWGLDSLSTITLLPRRKTKTMHRDLHLLGEMQLALSLGSEHEMRREET